MDQVLLQRIEHLEKHVRHLNEEVLSLNASLRLETVRAAMAPCHRQSVWVLHHAAEA